MTAAADWAAGARAYMLIGLISEDISSIAADTLGADSTGNREVILLRHIVQDPGCTPSQLAEALGIDRSSISRYVRSLEGQGLVRRQPEPTDGRSYRLHPTRRARRRWSSFVARVEEYLVSNCSTLMQINELLTPMLDDPTTAAAPTPPAVGELLDAMGRVGSALIDDFMGVAVEYGVQDWSDQLALSIVCCERDVRPTRLSTQLHISAGRLTKVVNRMERRGLVQRHYGLAEDRRGVIIECTPLGMEAVARIVHVVRRHADGLVSVFAAAVSLASALPAGR